MDENTRIPFEQISLKGDRQVVHGRFIDVSIPSSLSPLKAVTCHSLSPPQQESLLGRQRCTLWGKPAICLHIYQFPLFSIVLLTFIDWVNCYPTVSLTETHALPNDFANLVIQVFHYTTSNIINARRRYEIDVWTKVFCIVALHVKINYGIRNNDTIIPRALSDIPHFINVPTSG